MAVEVTLPRQGWSMEEAAFVEWLKQDGDRVKPGDPLFAVETDKTVQEIESLDDGILRIPPTGPRKGDMVHVGEVVGYLMQPGEDAPPGEFQETQTRHAATKPEVPRFLTTTAPEPVAACAERGAAPARQKASPKHEEKPAAERSRLLATVSVSPRAAKRALQEGVDLLAVTGSGAGGRIRERDVAAALSSGTRQFTAQTPARLPYSYPGENAPGREIHLSGLRRTIAQRMVASKTMTAPVTLTSKVNATALVGLRERFKVFAMPDEPVPTYNDLMLLISGAVLKDHPLLNAQWAEDRIIVQEAINIGIAVDTADGLLVPVVHDVPSLSLRQMAARTSDLIARARRRELTAEEMSGGTFTLSNLGGMGIDAFTPIINHPECAVLGLGRIVREPTIEGGQLVLRAYLWLSLTFDHRIVDGAPAARFLESVRHAVENPATRLAL